MSNPTIEKDSVTFEFQDGDASKVTIVKQAHLDENPTPASDSDDAFVIDFNGVLKTITVTGQLTDATTTRTDTGSVLTIEEQINWLEALVDGAQAGYLFNSTYQTNKKVFCRKVTFDEECGKVNESPFTIEFVEGL